MSLLLVMADDLEAGLASYLLEQLDPVIVRAYTLAEARRLVEARLFAAIILDTVLPDGDGVGFLRVLRDLNFQSGILILSASKSAADKVRAFDGGADDYIVRPYEAAEFLSRVRALLRRLRQRHGTAGEVLRVAGVALDVNALEVSLPDRGRQRLTPNEMRVLHYLMTHAGHVVDKQDLSARLFGAASLDTSSNAVGVYMRRVRRKIEIDPDHPHCIVTVRGKGYCFQGSDAQDEGAATYRMHPERGRHTSVQRPGDVLPVVADSY